jgi:hypothetical protein
MLEYGADFSGSGNNELRLTFSLDPDAQDGSEDLLVIAGTKFSTISANLAVIDITNGLMPGATESLSEAAGAGVVGTEVGTLQPHRSSSLGCQRNLCQVAKTSQDARH